MAKKVAKKAKKKPAKKKTVKKKSVKKTSKKSPKKTVKKASKKVVKKSAKKSGKPAVRKPAQKAIKKSSAVSLNVGDMAPAFTLSNQNGQNIALDSLRGRTVVLYFYPKDDTPGCTTEACDFRDNFARVNAQGAVVLGVSKDDIVSHTSFADKFQLPFDLLSDVEGQVCDAYGVWKEKSNYGKTYMGIERTTFVIDPEGKIKKVFPRVSVTGHVDEVLASI